MEYLVFGLAMVAFAAVIFGMEVARGAREKKDFMNLLYKNYTHLNDKKYPLERFVRMGSFFERHPKEGQLDDITWNDLGLDDVFKRMNYTLSASGEEYLYYTLRTLRQNREELEHLEDVIEYFRKHPTERVQIQFSMKKLGYTGKFSLYDYLDNLDFLGERSNGKSILLDLLFLPLIGLLWVQFPIGVMGIVILVVYNIVSYFKEKADIDPYIVSFSYIMRLMEACREMEKVAVPVCQGEWETLRESGRRMQGMKRNSYWVMSPYRGNTSGDILAVVMDYVRMVFHVDLIKFNSMLKFLRGHIEDVDKLIQTVGYVETAIAIGIYRGSVEASAKAFAARNDGNIKAAGNHGGEGPIDGEVSKDGNTVPAGGKGWCVPEFVSDRHIHMEEGYHPMLSDPVKNSISADRGVLLTGSNASGKSTFLKTMALNAIMAQTVHTCTADRYRAPFFRVYSSMALRDDMSSGESYYIVEIKALKRILDASVQGSSAQGTENVLCFVDEVLRGTNTVERIAASTQILKSLAGSRILCFAATHDIELTDLLGNEYDNYHFEEDVRDGDVYFNYRLMSGKATTRNAIRLLELMGFDHEIIEKAYEQAEGFMASGHWKCV